MACVSYINNAPISESAKDRLQGIHNDIFSRANKTQAFQLKEGKLFSPSIFRRGATAFIDKINETYSKKVAALTSDSFLTVNTLPLLQKNEIIQQEEQQPEITFEDKIIWGHPAIGKSYAAKKTKMIDFDSYKLGINKKYNLYIAPGLSDTELRTDDKTREARENWRYASPRNQELWNEFIKESWKKAKQDAKSQDAILFASDLLVLREFGDEVHKVLTMPKELFFERSKQRNNFIEGELGTEVWKRNIDKAVNNFKEKYDKNKVINTEKYLSDLLIENTVEDFQNMGYSLEDEFYMNKSLYNHGSFEDYNKYRMLSLSTELVGNNKDSENFQQYLEEQEMGDRNNFNFNCI